MDQLFLKNLKTVQFYLKFFNGRENYKMDKIALVLEPIIIIKYLKGVNCTDYDDLIIRVSEYLKAKSCLFLS